MSLANMAWVDKFFWDGRTNSLHEQVLLPIQDFHEMNLSLTDMVRRLNQSAFYRPMFQAAFGSENASSAAVADALSQFVHTMVSADSKYDRYLRGETTLTPLEQQGLQLFNTHPDGGTQRGANCNDCHSGVLQSADAFRNTGLQLVYADQGLANVTGRPTDNGKFRVMSLRNITVTPPFMHDGSLGSLLDVMDHYNLQVAAHPNVDPLLSVSNGSDPNSRQLLLNQQEISALVAFLHTLTDTTFLHNTAFSNPFEQ
jgi:cytochrome c peroxidase